MKENGYAYLYDRIAWWCSRNDLNLANQLFFNKTLKKEKKIWGIGGCPKLCVPQGEARSYDFASDPMLPCMAWGYDEILSLLSCPF